MCLSAEVWEEYSLLHFLNLQRNLYSCSSVTWIFKAWVLANFLPHNEHFLVVHWRHLHRMYFFSFTTRVFLFLRHFGFGFFISVEGGDGGEGEGVLTCGTRPIDRVT